MENIPRYLLSPAFLGEGQLSKSRFFHYGHASSNPYWVPFLLSEIATPIAINCASNLKLDPVPHEGFLGYFSQH